MHEYSLARSLVRQVLDIREREQAVGVNAVYVRVGEFAGVDGELLREAFRALAAEDGRLSGARVVLETVPLQAACGSCRAAFAIRQFRFACPHCGSRDVTITAGEELVLERIELEREVS